MIPTRQSVWVAGAWAAAGAVVAWLPAAREAWVWTGCGLALLGVADWLGARWRKPPTVERRLPGRFAVGQPGEVRVTVVNPGKVPARVRWFDGIPPGAEAPLLPVEASVAAGRRTQFTYQVSLFRRGPVTFGPLHGRVMSPGGFWWRGFRAGCDEQVRVYPDYAPVLRLALLAMDHRPEPMGIIRRSQAGVSREFHQLRDYREGDSLAQVDWKATSRHVQLISREFEEQRNQTVICLLDTGRRMRAFDGALPQFDHCLNAALLVSYVALRQGDLVGVQGFGGNDRWLPPVRGVHAMNDLLNHLYDYETTAEPSDFPDAVEKLMLRQRRRALVVLMTNLRGEDTVELLPALRVLRTRHLPLVASLRERSVDSLRRQPVAGFNDSLVFAAAEGYLAERRRVLSNLGREGIITVDATATDLPVALANRYLEIKRSARL